jgi:hypothetical protein
LALGELEQAQADFDHARNLMTKPPQRDDPEAQWIDAEARRTFNR